mmetsp:Transcript_9565/g.26033  ORF Transcript_9565/g.26033 Transcript_9565/m.26033 type:complete len:210 (+) Transcript_9565:638-1267(+)
MLPPLPITVNHAARFSGGTAPQTSLPPTTGSAGSKGTALRAPIARASIALAQSWFWTVSTESPKLPDRSPCTRIKYVAPRSAYHVMLPLSSPQTLSSSSSIPTQVGFLQVPSYTVTLALKSVSGWHVDARRYCPFPRTPYQTEDLDRAKLTGKQETPGMLGEAPSCNEPVVASSASTSIGIKDSQIWFSAPMRRLYGPVAIGSAPWTRM